MMKYRGKRCLQLLCNHLPYPLNLQIVNWMVYLASLLRRTRLDHTLQSPQRYSEFIL